FSPSWHETARRGTSWRAAAIDGAPWHVLHILAAPLGSIALFFVRLASQRCRNVLPDLEPSTAVASAPMGSMAWSKPNPLPRRHRLWVRFAPARPSPTPRGGTVPPR